jgi:hypothetical protein
MVILRIVSHELKLIQYVFNVYLSDILELHKRAEGIALAALFIAISKSSACNKVTF